MARELEKIEKLLGKDAELWCRSRGAAIRLKCAIAP